MDNWLDLYLQANEKKSKVDYQFESWVDEVFMCMKCEVPHEFFYKSVANKWVRKMYNKDMIPQDAANVLCKAVGIHKKKLRL